MDNKPTLHLIGLFHTQSTTKFSHCAFTGKALRFPKMMQLAGYKIIEYSNEGSESTADEHVTMLSKDVFEALFEGRKKTDFYGDNASIGSAAHTMFQGALIRELKKRVEPTDIICHPFGHAHEILLSEFPYNQHVETGIGYPTLMEGSFRIFESYAWMHYHQGKAGRNGANYEWVIPNYFDLEEWEPKYDRGNYIAFLGRICPNKGLDTVLEIARRSPYPVKIAGQGDPSPWSHPNLEYLGPLSGKKRSDFLRNAYCAVMPTVYTEPFGGSGVEAMLCGTPLIAVDYGAFTETVKQGVTGFRCRTLREWVDAIDNVRYLDRKVVANTSRSLYSLETCSKQYDEVFTSLYELHDKGWYSCDNLSYSSELKKLAEESCYFVSIGAMDGVKHDRLFEHAAANLNWKGMLVEPVKEYFDKLKVNYGDREGLTFENVAIMDEEGDKEIFKIPSTMVGEELPEWADGISTFYPDGGAFSKISDKAVTEEVKCVRFETLVDKHSIPHIDILQIDAEGADFQIFYQIWNLGFRPQVVLIEVIRMSFRNQATLRELLIGGGYRVRREGDDWLATK